MPKKEIVIKHITILAAYLFIVWGLYRQIFYLEEGVDELIVKPILWLVPVFYFVRKEKLGLASLGITAKNLFPSVYLALSLGVLFALEAVVINYIKYEGFDFGANIGQYALFIALGISMATAVSEEIAFRGYFFNRLNYALDDEFKANLISSTIWGLIHLPIAIFWLSLSPSGVLGYFLLTTIFGVGAAFIFARTKNVVAPILLHVLWSWPIILFR